MKIRMGNLGGFALGLGLVAGSASAASSLTTVYDFNGFAHTTALSNQIDGLKISAVNDNPGTVGQAIAWDYNARPDLASRGHYGPAHSGGNVGGGTNLGNGVALKGADGAFSTLEGRRPAGTLTFEFAKPQAALSFTLVDVEGHAEFQTNSGYFLDFFSDNSELGRVFFGDLITPGSSNYDPTIEFGNATVNRIGAFEAIQFGAESFNRVELSLGGSGTVAQITATAVPTPSAVFGGLSLIGLVAARRRRAAEEALSN